PSWSRTTASVFVPPTSMPSRRSSGRGMQLLDRLVVEVVAERARARRGEAALAAPDVVAAQRDDADALSIAQPLGRDRSSRLAVEHGDDVGNRGDHASVLERNEVLVLDLDPQR